VRARYAEPHRRYHTVEHLDEVMAAVAELADLADDPRAVELAVLFHDAVYDPASAPGESERASAGLAAAALGGDSIAPEVVRLVLLTAGHEVEPGDRNGAVLADADLWILGSSPERYARYAADVRAEYGHVDDDAWRAGRSALLRGFLDRPRLFRTDRFHARFDAAARRNLAGELAALVGPQPET
jgi:predicted metal-dependent HD superfamily phosphohydrolase